jgi:hypothetical protein
MDDRTLAAEIAPATRTPDRRPAGGPAALDDPRALTILTTEHWSLLSARALVYNEAFARAGMFLTFLSATLVALGLVSTATGFSRDFLVVAAVVLAVDLFVGLATMGRVASATAEDIRYLQGMNRLRHAYHEAVPGLERYFISGHHDDLRGVFAVYSTTEEIASRSGVLHGFTTVPGMVGVICAVVASVLVALVALLATGSGALAGVAGVVALFIGVAASVATMTRKIAGLVATMAPRFPTPRDNETPEGTADH